MKRVTIVLHDKLVKKIHDIQATKIRRSSTSVSFSGVINEILAGVLKVKIDK